MQIMGIIYLIKLHFSVLTPQTTRDPLGFNASFAPSKGRFVIIIEMKQ